MKHADIVVVQRKLYRIIGGVIGLYNHLSRLLSSGPSAHLLNHRERALFRAVVAIGEHCIRIDNRCKCDPVKVQSPRDHLCSDEDIGAAVLKAFVNPPVRVLFSRRVKVHPENPRIWKKLVDFVFDLLGSAADRSDKSASASLASSLKRIDSSTIMAHQYVFAVLPMQFERYIAVFAHLHRAALQALYARGITAPI